MSSLTNVLLARWEGGWYEGGDPTSETNHGRAEARLDLGGAKLATQVDNIIQTVVGGTSGSRVATVAEVEPVDLQQVYVAFGPFDRVNVVNPDGDIALAAVQAISVNADDNGHPAWTIEFANPVIERAQQVDTWLRRRLPGSLAGTTETVNPATPASIIESGDVQAKEWRVSKTADETNLTSLSERLQTVAHLCLWEVTLDEAQGSDVTVILVVSGTTVATVTVPTGEQTGHAPIAAHLVNTTDKIWADITAGPADVPLVGRARYI
jgi:hypothetical protein